LIRHTWDFLLVGFLFSRTGTRFKHSILNGTLSNGFAHSLIGKQRGLRQVLLVQKSRDVIRDNEQDVLSCSGKVKFKGEQVSLDIPIGASDFPT